MEQTIEINDFVYDSELKCKILYKDNSSRIVEIKYSFLMTNFLKELYNTDLNDWKWVDVYFLNKGNKYGRLVNNKETKLKTNKKLTKKDFTISVVKNSYINCTVYLKSEPHNPRKYKIRKTTLCEKFISKLYNLFGDDWEYFEMKQYGIVLNNAYRKQYPYLTPMGLQIRENNIRKIEKSQEIKTEKVYLMYFQNKNIFKIGHTYQNTPSRIFNYTVARSDYEKENYENAQICFSKSFFIETEKELECSSSFEKEILNKFSNQRIIKKKKTEYFEKQHYTNVVDFIKSISNERGYIIRKINNLEIEKFAYISF